MNRTQVGPAAQFTRTPTVDLPGSIASTRANGYTQLRGMFSSGPMKELGQHALRTAIRHSGTGPPHGETSADALEHTLRIRNCWQLDAALRQSVMNLHLAQHAAEMLGAEGVQLYSDLLVVREPGGVDDGWHIDAVHMCVPGDSVVAAYIPLNNPTDGPTLELIPASHTLPECREFKLHRATTLRRIRNRVVRIGRPVVTASSTPGDVLLFSGNLFHRLRANRSKQPAVSLWIYYFMLGQSLSRPKNPSQVIERARHFAEVHVGRPIYTPLNPLVSGG